MDIHAESLRHVTRADGSLANWFDEVLRLRRQPA
jgi:hypothetical protein